MRRLLLTSLLLASTPAVAVPAGRSAETIAAATEAARIAPRPDGWQGATQMFRYAPGGLYQIDAAVGRVTDLALQAGETLSDTGAVASGDTVRWVIGEAASGTGATRRTHILVKPTDPGLVTNLVVNTDRRTYHVELRSTTSTYVASVAWSYPQDELIAVKARAEAAKSFAATQVQSGIDPTALNFVYRIGGDSPLWRPSQVFDDGAKTYILFPETIGQSELPPLFLIGGKGEAELVNYRVAGRYMIVDRLFGRAELRLGTRRQEIVRIDRVQARERKR
jgi:type IV secretion system protein VirB9